MFITKTSLARRTFLRGMGAAVGLPVLEAMVPAMTALAQTAANPKMRFGAVFVPNGAIVEQWSPSAAGADFEFTPILQPLERFRDQLVVVSNLTRAQSGRRRGRPRDQRRRVAERRATRSGRRRRTCRAGTTIDQIVAGRIGQDTPFPSLELATADFTGYVGRLHERLQLRVHEHDLVELADDAAADGDQPARGVRAPVRPAGHAGRSARRACSGTCSILDLVDAAGRRSAARPRARATGPARASTWTTSARSSGASSGRKRATSPEVASFDAADRHARSRSRSTWR